MNVVKPGIWGGKRTKRSGHMAMHLGSLTLKAGAGPVSDIHIDTWPHIPTGHKALHGTNARMRN